MDKKEKQKDYSLQRTYGISLDEYKTLLKKQNHKCAWCGMDANVLKKEYNKSLVVEHSHVTGKVRGLLCVYCNRALGMLTENPYCSMTPNEFVTKIGEYIEKYNMEEEHHIIKEGKAKYKNKGTGLHLDLL